MNNLRLPRPDEHGNYWFKQHQSAIFPSKRRGLPYSDEPDIVSKGNYILCVNGEFLFKGADFVRFETVEEAFRELLKRLPSK